MNENPTIVPHSNNEIRKVGMSDYELNSDRYELRPGNTSDAPLCPYGNCFQWIGYDLKEKEYVRFTKSVFKKLINSLP